MGDIKSALGVLGQGISFGDSCRGPKRGLRAVHEGPEVCAFLCVYVNRCTWLSGESHHPSSVSQSMGNPKRAEELKPSALGLADKGARCTQVAIMTTIQTYVDSDMI